MNQKVAIGFGLVLLLIVIIQSIFLYRMSGQVDKIGQTAASSTQLSSKPSRKLAPPSNPLNSKDDKSWNPFEEMQRMQNEMNKIFGDMRSNFYRSPRFDDMFKSFTFSPTLDMREEDNQFVIKVDIPGSDASNINVKIEDQQLTISATTNKSNDGKSNGQTFRSERFMGQFNRSVTLPAPVLADKMKTDYKDGVLTTTVPKA